MLMVVWEEDETGKAQTLFMGQMKNASSRTGTIVVGHKGEIAQYEALWSKEFGIWWVSKKLENRYWNAFGTGQPRWNSKCSHSIICEINIPFSGIDRRISGVFAKDIDGKIYLLHRGRIGGGRIGIGKTGFKENYGGEWQDVSDGDRVSSLALIASLDSPRFAQQVTVFVHEIERIKAILSAKTGVH